MARSPLSDSARPAPSPRRARIRGGSEAASAVPTSEIEIKAKPISIAGLRPVPSANPPEGRLSSSSDTAGAEMRTPLSAEDNPISLVYNGSIGMMAPTPMKSTSCPKRSTESGEATAAGTPKTNESCAASSSEAGSSGTSLDSLAAGGSARLPINGLLPNNW